MRQICGDNQTKSCSHTRVGRTVFLDMWGRVRKKRLACILATLTLISTMCYLGLVSPSSMRLLVPSSPSQVIKNGDGESLSRNLGQRLPSSITESSVKKDDIGRRLPRLKELRRAHEQEERDRLRLLNMSFGVLPIGKLDLDPLHREKLSESFFTEAMVSKIPKGYFDLTRLRTTTKSLKTAIEKSLRSQAKDAGSKTKTSTCTAVQNVAFVKTHKAGSSTVASILQRYGMMRNLTFALPNKPKHTFGYNYLSRPGDVMTKDSVRPLPPGRHEYNILFNHAVYNRTAFHLIMPENTVYFSILREPFSQFVSSFEYYSAAYTLSQFNKSILSAPNPMSLYLQRPYWFEKSLNPFSYIKNKQSQDFGMGRQQFVSLKELKNYIAELDKDFAFVMIMEYFDESLILLKRMLCWETHDVLYIMKNKNTRKPMRSFTKEDKDRHRKIARLDYVLYGHFYEVFQKKLKEQDQDFFDEVSDFKKLLDFVDAGCAIKGPINIPKTKWYDSFTVTNLDCRLLRIGELSALDLLLSDYSTSSNKNEGSPGPSGQDPRLGRRRSQDLTTSKAGL